MLAKLSYSAEAAESEIRKELDRGERLLWSGVPRQGLLLRPSDTFMIPFSLFWGGFVFFWEYSAIHEANAPSLFPIWGLPFVVIGLYLMVGRFFYDSAERRRTYYGVTNQRILIVKGIFSRDISSVLLRNLSEMSLTERSDGSGTITFGPVLSSFSLQWEQESWSPSNQHRTPTFEAIDRVREVFGVIKDAQQSAK